MFKTNKIILFVLFLVAQVIVSTYVNLGPLFFICFYPLFILSLSVRISPIPLMLLSFVMGLGVDILTDGIWGLNAAASVALAFSRPLLLYLFAKRSDLESLTRAGLSDMGFVRYTTYIISGLTIHHSVYAILENLGTPFFVENFLMMGLSIIINTFIILLIEFGIFYKNTR